MKYANLILALALLLFVSSLAQAGTKEKVKSEKIQANGTLTVVFEEKNPKKIESVSFSTDGEDGTQFTVDVKKSKKGLGKFNGKKVAVVGKAIGSDLIILSIKEVKKEKVKT